MPDPDNHEPAPLEPIAPDMETVLEVEEPEDCAVDGATDDDAGDAGDEEKDEEVLIPTIYEE